MFCLASVEAATGNPRLDAIVILSQMSLVPLVNELAKKFGIVSSAMYLNSSITKYHNLFQNFKNTETEKNSKSLLELKYFVSFLPCTLAFYLMFL